MPTIAVAAVAVAAVLSAVMVKRADTESPQQAILEPARPISSSDVVTAPPLARPAQVMGGAPACAECGVVHMVVAVYEQGKPQPRAYQMHIRMDNGSVRTIEQRGALAAGSRVIVEGTAVRPM